VVDFADIRKEFDATNKAYFDELQLELGDEMEHYNQLFKSKEEIESEIQDIKDILFRFDTQNAEIFSQQVSLIQDKKTMLQLVKVLENAKSLYNLIRLFGHYELLEQLDFKKLTILSREANNHLALLNDKESLENGTDSNNLLNIALEDVLFMFVKISEEELVLADELKDTLRKTREALLSNFDQHDPEFISLKEELERLFKKKNLNEITQDEMKRNIGALTKIFDKVSELNRRNNLLKAKYENDAKYARIHKRLAEKGTLTQRERQIFEALKGVKTDVDEQVLQNTRVLGTGSYFNTMVGRLIIRQFKNVKKIDLDAEATKYINKLVVKEYMDEFYGRTI